MTIEIKQLVVRSDVVEGEHQNIGQDTSIDAVEFGSIKEQLLEECEEWLLDRRVERRER